MPIMQCPNHPEHKNFVTAVITYQLWMVDENGDWVETLDDCLDYLPPSTDGVWECVDCGAIAEGFKLRLVEPGEKAEE